MSFCSYRTRLLFSVFVLCCVLNQVTFIFPRSVETSEENSLHVGDKLLQVNGLTVDNNALDLVRLKIKKLDFRFQSAKEKVVSFFPLLHRARGSAEVLNVFAAH